MLEFVRGGTLKGVCVYSEAYSTFLKVKQLN